MLPSEMAIPASYAPSIVSTAIVKPTSHFIRVARTKTKRTGISPLAAGNHRQRFIVDVLVLRHEPFHFGHGQGVTHLRGGLDTRFAVTGSFTVFSDALQSGFVLGAQFPVFLQCGLEGLNVIRECYQNYT